ncbi:methyltransferase domain-containing protein [bacterium]|nr:methyltransferase domain-containing protein [bacterium]
MREFIKPMLADLLPEIHPLTNAQLLPKLLPLLRCSSCGKCRFDIHRDESTMVDIQTHCVVVCDECQSCFKYENGILEVLVEKASGLSIAQKSNFIGLVANSYQSGWRSWCMSVFCGQKCPNAMEAEKIIQLIEFDELPENPVFVDFGTSHGFYAIAIARKLKEMNSAGFVIAIDFSKKMLRQAVVAAEKNSVSERIIWILADVEACPLQNESAVRVTCGGSLNEYRHPEKAIQESARVLKRGGSYITMNLFRKNNWSGWLLSFVHLLSGLVFFSQENWNRLFTGGGFRIVQQEIKGIVMFTASKK